MWRVYLLIPLALVLSACGGGSKGGMSAGNPLQTVQVSEKEFSITPSTISLAQPGTYAFKVTNDGQVTHAFALNGARTPDIQPGQSATLTIDLSHKGADIAYCPIDGHRSKGMEAKIGVGTPASSTTSTSGPTSSTTSTTSSQPGY